MVYDLRQVAVFSFVRIDENDLRHLSPIEIKYLPAQEHGSGCCPKKFEQLYVKVIGDNVATLIHLGTESTNPFPM